MPTLELTILAKSDGVDVPGFPWIYRTSVASLSIEDGHLGPSGVVFAPLGTAPIASVIALRTLNQPVTVRLNGQTDAGIPLNAGGFVVIVGAAIDAGVNLNLTVRNSTLVEALSQNVVAGT